VRLGRPPPWYVQPALEARRAHGRRARRRAAAGLLSLCVATVGLTACGGGSKRQDENEPEGRFQVEVVEAKFPAKQKLAKRSNLVITVRNAGDRAIPNVAVTVDGFDLRKDDPNLADPSRPAFVINGKPKQIGGFPESKEAAPEGCDTAYVNTWACGRLKAGAEKSFEWSVTAVHAGTYKIKYTIAAGLDGKARAVDASGNRPTGVFTGTIDNTPPDTRVADDGKTVIEGTR
jgi:hypothetical protein